MNLGDFVRHSRQGPGRITQILPEYVEVKARDGHVYKVSRAVAEHELVPVPPDGFTALLATRDPSSDFLLEHINDVTQRIFRDRRKSSLSKKEIRQELEPFLQREGKSYTAWWKRAQKKLLDSGGVVVDPKRKTNLVIAGDHVAGANQDWTAELGKISSAADLLDYSRRLYADESGDDRVAVAAYSVMERIARELSASMPGSRSRLELLLALSYIGCRVGQNERSIWVKIVEGVKFTDLPIARDLDEDVSLAVVLLGKLTPRKAAEWATLLLNHPAASVAKRAFASLNSDRFRLILKKPLLEWLRSATSAPPSPLDLYLDEGFLCDLRKEDKAALYARVSKETDQTPASRQFLSRPEYARIAAELHTEDIGAGLRAVSGQRLDDVGRSQFVAALGADKVLENVLKDFQPELSQYLGDAIKTASWTTLRLHAAQLINTLTVANNAELNIVTVRRIVTVTQEAEGLDLLLAVSFGCELRAMLPAERDGSLDRALQGGFSKLVKAESDDVSPLSAAVQIEVASRTDELTRKSHLAREELSAAVERARRAEQEVERLQAVVNIVKASAADERTGSKHQVLQEFVTPLLPLLDEMQRRSDLGDVAARQFRDDLLASLEQAGVRQVSPVGRNETFDPQKHRLLGDQEGALDKVVTVRAGYALTHGDHEVVVRHALVRPVKEEAH
jgi:molecular chaperone GrpE (heat shock protein)